MSCVAPLKATTPRIPMHTAKNEGRCRARATHANPTPHTILVVTTMILLFDTSSSSGLHRNFRVQGNIIIEVQSAIWLSAMPSHLNISTQTILRITNGSPIAKYAEGTHFKGRLVSVFIIVAVYKACTLHI